MYGGGIKTGITAVRDFKALLDVSRLISRVGFGPHTGVDRVELAYLEWCLSTNAGLFGLARVSGGVCLLERDGLIQLYAKLTDAKSWGRRDFRGLIGLKTSKLRAQAESDVRRMALATSVKPEFHSVDLSKYIYLNIGHSNQKLGNLDHISKQVAQTVVFVHDVIPLEFPDFQRPEMVETFRRKISAIDKYADLVIFNSDDTERRSQRFLLSKPKSIFAHLGVDAPKVKPVNSNENRPYFLAIGTIEPRKNHKLLLEIWADLPPENKPHLHIVGRRGWKNEDVFGQLDRAKVSGHVTEHNDLPDTDMWTLLAGARALLFPSVAEGFGLPSLEAAALGVPVICGDLAIHRELLGDYPVYVDLQDPYLWQKAVLEKTQATYQPQRPVPHIPTWNEHFARVNQAITEKR